METYTPVRFAQALRTGSFDDGVPRRLDIGTAREVSVNLTALTAQEQGLARAALGEWRAITGIRFTETSGAATITYNHSGTTATTRVSYSGETIVKAVVSIASNRVEPGDTVGDYVFRTYMHETAHALGLGHPQDYGQAPNFSQSAIANDSWQMSLMSYYSQTENTVIDASHAYNLTPMLADYLAIRASYGAVPVRAGNTVYGVGSTAGGALDQMTRVANPVTFLIADTGGHDRLSFAGDSRGMRINLNPGAISDVLGLKGNMQIATDTAIEDVTGGRGNDGITGNRAANRIDGGGGNDVMVGGLGNDTYITDGGDRLIEAANAGTDIVVSTVNHTLAANLEQLVLVGGATVGFGNELGNRLTGTAGANTLDGRGGADVMIGLGGNDRYVVTAGDVVVEAAGGGYDTVSASINARLAANAEALLLEGSAAISGTGNELANYIRGNAAGNRIDGLAGYDTLEGGGGNDVYILTAGDAVREYAGGGFDTIWIAANYTLAGEVEAGILGGTTGFRLDGNALNNRLTGNGAANLLRGQAGNDTLAGGLGNDTMAGGLGDDIYIISGSDTVLEAANSGYDTCQFASTGALAAQVERLVLVGTGAYTGVGNELENVIAGNNAGNTLNGFGGNDFLYGKGGADRFVFSAAGVDRVMDFANDVDTLMFSASFAGGSSVNDAMSHAYQSGDNVIFDFGGGNAVLVYNAVVSQLRDDVLVV